MSTRPLTELRAAVAAGFHRWSDFCRARESGVFPVPARELPGFGPIWTQQQIDRWLGVVDRPEAKSNPGEEALRRVRERASKRRARS